MQALQFRVKRASLERLELPAPRVQLDPKETRERQELAVCQDQQDHKEIREMLDPQPQLVRMGPLDPLDQRDPLEHPALLDPRVKTALLDKLEAKDPLERLVP